MTTEALGWFLAGAGWAVAALALALALRFRADWSTIWHYAWTLRRAGFEVTDRVETVMLERLTPKRPAVRPNVHKAEAPVVPELPPALKELIETTSEDWHRDELATAAREMLARGVSEADTIDEIRQLMRG